MSQTAINQLRTKVGEIGANFRPIAVHSGKDGLPERPAAGAAGPLEHAPWSGAHLGPYFAIQVAMRAEVLSAVRWSAQNASSMRK